MIKLWHWHFSDGAKNLQVTPPHHCKMFCRYQKFQAWQANKKGKIFSRHFSQTLKSIYQKTDRLLAKLVFNHGGTYENNKIVAKICNGLAKNHRDFDCIALRYWFKRWGFCSICAYDEKWEVCDHWKAVSRNDSVNIRIKRRYYWDLIDDGRY